MLSFELAWCTRLVPLARSSESLGAANWACWRNFAPTNECFVFGGDDNDGGEFHVCCEKMGEHRLENVSIARVTPNLVNLPMIRIVVVMNVLTVVEKVMMKISSPRCWMCWLSLRFNRITEK